MQPLHLWSIWSIFNLLTDHASPALAFPNNNPNTITTIEEVIVEISTAETPVVFTLPLVHMPISALSEYMVTSYVTTHTVITATEPDEPLITPAPSIPTGGDFGALKTLTINQETLMLVMKEGQKVGLPTISPSATSIQNFSSTSVSSTTTMSNVTAVDKKDIGVIIGLSAFMVTVLIYYTSIPIALGLTGIKKVVTIDDKVLRRLNRFVANDKMDYAKKPKEPPNPLDDNGLSEGKPLYPRPKPVEEVLQNMIDVRDPTTRSIENMQTVRDVEAFLLKSEQEQPGGTFSRDAVYKISEILGPGSSWMWKILTNPTTPTWILRYNPFDPQEERGMQEETQDPPTNTPQRQTYPSTTTKRTRQISFADETVRLTTYPSRPMPTRTEVPTQRRKTTRRPAPPREPQPTEEPVPTQTEIPTRTEVQTHTEVPTQTQVPTQRRKTTRRPAPPKKPEPTKGPAPTVTVASQPPCAPFTYVDCCIQVLGYVTKCFGGKK